ncbi:hypothetical protein [Acrocarpospora sp. B8E8]|uniref:hypothetical protein n=1 Tax=Acrocarpospora sp. B8E8 TaxID=3153572 RepID=UPI00325CA45C
MTVHGRYTGILRDDLSYAFDMDAQDFPGVDFSDGLYRANMRRIQAMSNAAALTTQVMTSVPLFLRAGDVVTSLTTMSATTAANTPTNYWYALYNPSGALLRQTADQEDDAWVANTVKTLALTAPVTIATTGWHRVGIMVKATAVPTLAGVTLHHANLSALMVTGSGELVLSGTSNGSSLTDTAPSTLGALTAIAGVPYVVAT